MILYTGGRGQRGGGRGGGGKLDGELRLDTQGNHVFGMAAHGNNYVVFDVSMMKFGILCYCIYIRA